jgi:hypothetical protein
MRILLFVTITVLSAADIPILDVSQLELKNTKATVSKDRALQLAIDSDAAGDGIAFVKGTHFKNGTIDLDVSGSPSKSAGDFARGFIGLNFHIQEDRAHWENIYIRPTNGRAPDQLRRNHSTQYTSYPDWPWERLRKDTPGVYESYTDLIPGEWTHMRIEVQSTNASLYVGSASQPCLLIHDLKLGEVGGSIALWIGPGTEGAFRNLKISEK